MQVLACLLLCVNVIGLQDVSVIMMVQSVCLCNVGYGQAFEGAVGGLESLGIFGASNVAQRYCEAIRQLVEQDPAMATMLLQSTGDDML